MGERLTKRRLLAIDMALSAMLAGMEGEGDWDPEIPAKDLEAASRWTTEQLAKREKGDPA